MIENMGESIDAILMPCIARSFIKKGRNFILKFAGKDLTVHPNFKLFLQTKLSNPHYPPEVQAEATLVNFTVTEDGLGDQLLYLIVKRERPDLAAKKLELITQQNDFKIKLKELEDELLFKLANAKGDILDDIALIENLEYSKKIAIDIGEKVEIAKVTEAKINETSEMYRPAASRGALIYFLLSDLPKIYSFYKYSLESFIDVINRAIDQITEGLETKQNMFELDAEGKAIIPEARKRRKTKKKTKIEEGEAEPEAEAVPEAKPEGEKKEG
jgi:dynein heavy chain, axonemal